MQSYKSKSGKKSGVVGFEIGPDFIKVEFEKGENIYILIRAPVK